MVELWSKTQFPPLQPRYITLTPSLHMDFDNTIEAVLSFFYLKKGWEASIVLSNLMWREHDGVMQDKATFSNIQHAAA